MYTCPECSSPYAYQDGMLLTCPECAYEWAEQAQEALIVLVKDANGTPLQDGDSVTLIKSLKLKGSNDSLKQGTKIKNIRLVPEGDHNIDCKINGMAIMLKSEFVKKS